MFYIHTSTALASFEFHGLFCDYVSTQMAEGRDKGNNHLFPQLWTLYLLIYRPNRTTEWNKVSLHGTELAYVLNSYVTRNEGRSASRTLQALHPK